MSEVLLIPRPTTKFPKLSDDQRQSISDQISRRSDIGLDWLEKIRRFSSVSGRNLRSVTIRKYGADCNVHLRWMADILIDNSFNRKPFAGAPVDQAMLNAALYCVDALGVRRPSRVQDSISALQEWLCATKPLPLQPSAMGIVFDGNVEYWRNETKCNGLVIICPSPYSLYSLSVISILNALGISIEALIVRKFSVSRLRQEWRRDGPRLLKKIWRKLVLRSDENADRTEVSLKSVCDALKPLARDVRVIAQKHGIPVVEVEDLDDTLIPLSKLAPRLAIFTGGGLIGKSVLDAFPDGIINVHMGSLPHHKGMDVVQAPILEGYFDDVALTAHLMEPRLDRGPVLSKFRVSSDGYPTLGALRNELSAVLPLIAVDAALGVSSKRLTTEVQEDLGRQYYFIHQSLCETIDHVMKQRYQRRDSNRVNEMVKKAMYSLRNDRSVESSPA